MMPVTAADFADIQGLVRSGYGNLTAASFLLLRIADRSAACAWIADAPVTTAAEREASQVLQVALSVDGMRALGLKETVLGWILCRIPRRNSQ